MFMVKKKRKIKIVQKKNFTKKSIERKKERMKDRKEEKKN